jgi:lysophospholipase L1-like esterase
MRWVGTWACGPQLTEPENDPPPPGLAGNTLRQVVFASIGGARLRLRLSNEHGDGPVTMEEVHVAPSTAGGGVRLAFSGAPSVTIAGGEAVFSDPFDLAVAPLSTVAVTIAFGATPRGITGCPGARTTSHIATGNRAAAATLAAAATVEHWYYIAGLDVLADDATAAAVALGDSITGGRGSTTDGNDRFTDGLSRRLRANPPTAKAAVLNLGIGGNAVLGGGLGPTAVERFARDVLEMRGVRWLILFEGVNDIGGASDEGVAARLIAAFGRLVDTAHAHGIRVYGVPLTPFGGSHYDSPAHENARAAVNRWIRTGGKLDAVIDLDAAVRDPAAPTKLLAAYDCGDHLHPSPAGYRKMADSIDLALFTNP